MAPLGILGLQMGEPRTDEVRAPRRGRSSLILALVAFAAVAGGALWAASRY